jgi:murein DD-endopeptidase MepM/ murein hydrolase activator NlpD
MRNLRRSARFMMTVAAAALLSACSSSLERFSVANAGSYDNPSDADPVYTAAIRKPKRAAKAVKTYSEPVEEQLVEEPIVSKPLAGNSLAKQKLAFDYSDSYKKKPAYKQKPSLKLDDQPIEREPEFADNGAEDTFAPAQAKQKIKTASAKPAIVPKSGRIRVESGMTLYSIARSNGVTVEELASANGLKKPYWVSAGTVLLLPGVAAPTMPRSTLQSQRKQMEEEQGTSLASEESQDSFVSKKSTFKTASNLHSVEGGDTLYSLGRKYGISPFIIADANGLSRDASLVLGQKVKIPAGGTAAAAKPKLATKQVAKIETTAEPEAEVVVDEEPKIFAKSKKKLTLEPDVAENAEAETAVGEEPVVAEQAAPKQLKLKETAKVETPAAEQLAMRWPARGKVISEYGPKTNGMKNEGINIAVPEGTSIRAAESGVVAYAGNELKGYGNLILVRHAGGYVTAYAHAKELIVKRGDKVKRGDVIAKAGQTGAVSSPQLHFEVRKGATALDPQKFLGSSTAMN